MASEDPLHYVPASEIEPADAEYVLAPGFVQKAALSTTVGPKGVGKTTHACLLTAQVTRGLVPGGPQRVAYDPGEDPDLKATLRPRLEAAGADLGLVLLPVQFLTFPDDLKRFARYLKKERPALHILDGLSSFIPGYTSAPVARRVMTELAEIAAEYDCAIYFNHELRDANTLERAFAGAGAILRASRGTYVFGLEPEGREDAEIAEETPRRVWAPWHVTNAALRPTRIYRLDLARVEGLRAPVPRLVPDGSAAITAEEIFEDHKNRQKLAHKEPGAVKKAMDFVLYVLGREGGEVLSSRLTDDANAAGFGPRTVEKARAVLKSEGTIDKRHDGVTGAWYVFLRNSFENLTADDFR
jgi:hypothetical protein